MATALKLALEDLLRTRRLQAEEPPLRGEDRRARLLPTGIALLDERLEGGLPRGSVSSLHGPASSGRTGLALSLVAQVTGEGGIAGWVDPLDRFDPASAHGVGVDLSRLLWLRGAEDDTTTAHRAAWEVPPRALAQAAQAAATLASAGVFDLVVFDLAGAPPTELRRLPSNTWLRFSRLVEGTTTAFVLLACVPLPSSGLSLALVPAGARWQGAPGPGRLLHGLATDVRPGRHELRGVPVELRAV